MSFRNILAVLLFVVAVNGVVLGGVAWNRSGVPDGTLTLTERELDMSRGDDEDSGIYLRLRWQQGGRDWFDAATLKAVGFDTSVPPEGERGRLFYSKALPRRTFVVLEQEGEAWGAWLRMEEEQVERMERKLAAGEVTAKQMQEARQSLAEKRRGASRLFVVAADNDPGKLRSRYPDGRRHVIVPAEVRLLHDDVRGAFPHDGRATIHGRVDRVLVDVMAVPRHVAEPVLKLAAKAGTWSGYPGYGVGSGELPRYGAVISFGRRHEPWVAAMSLL